MMTKRILLVFLGGAAIVMALITSTIEDSRNREELITALSTEIELYKKKAIDYVDIAQVTSFSWDTMYVFGPYSNSQEISKVTKLAWTKYSRVYSSEGYSLLVFMDEDRLVQYIDFPRNYGDFACCENYQIYSVEEANFIIDEKERMI